MMSLFELGVNHACLTGDCDHRDVYKCFVALSKYINELCTDGKRLENETALLNRKIQHGCGDFCCSDCDQMEEEEEPESTEERIQRVEEKNWELEDRIAKVEARLNNFKQQMVSHSRIMTNIGKQIVHVSSFDTALGRLAKQVDELEVGQKELNRNQILYVTEDGELRIRVNPD
jgi:predicted RNase H-like nuclease (RuvC/YqgF family)